MQTLTWHWRWAFPDLPQVHGEFQRQLHASLFVADRLVTVLRTPHLPFKTRYCLPAFSLEKN